MFEATYRVHQIEDTFYHETLHKKSLEPYQKKIGTLFEVTEDNVVQCKKCPYTANLDTIHHKKGRKRRDPTWTKGREILHRPGSL